MENVKILIIDDDMAISNALDILLNSQGWESLVANDGLQGLAMFKKEKPNLVLADYHMPNMNGLLCVQEIKKIDPIVPIIVFTIDERQELADKFMEAGASDFATKPIKAPDIISRIKLHLRLLELEKNAVKEQINEPVKYLAKGIGESTLQIIIDALDKTEYATVEEISSKSGFAYQTTYRYLQYMTTEDMVEIKSNYGKVGRPKQEYRLKTE